MSNFFCEDAYMDSRRYYDDDHSWDEQDFKTHSYDMPYYNEESHPMSLYDMSYDYEEPLPRSMYDMNYHYEESFEIPEYDMPNSYEDPNFPRRSQRYQDQNSYSRLEEKQAQEAEPSLASIVAQLAVCQAQQQKDNQLILQQLELLQTQSKMLQIQVAYQASLKSRNRVELHSQSDFIDSTIPECGNILEESQFKDEEESNDEDEYHNAFSITLLGLIWPYGDGVWWVRLLVPGK